MTTERSGMSLEKRTINDINEWADKKMDRLKDPNVAWIAKLIADTYVRPIDITMVELADAIDSHLSRDAVVSDEDVERACAAYLDGWRGKTDLDGDLFRIQMRAALSSFASRRSAVPDAIAGPGIVMSKQDVRDAYYAEGWNACRKAMLAQRDGVDK